MQHIAYNIISACVFNFKLFEVGRGTKLDNLASHFFLILFQPKKNKMFSRTIFFALAFLALASAFAPAPVAFTSKYV